MFCCSFPCSRSTEPDAFFLDGFFNAHPVHPNALADSKEKYGALNALVPTVVAYAGGQVDFTVDMGTEVRWMAIYSAAIK